MHEENTSVHPRVALSERLSHGLPTQEPMLIRMAGSYPYVYGYLAYEDPYVDYVAVCLLGVESPEGGVVAWSGTRKDYHRRWESFIPAGVS